MIVREVAKEKSFIDSYLNPFPTGHALDPLSRDKVGSVHGGHVTIIVEQRLPTGIIIVFVAGNVHGKNVVGMPCSRHQHKGTYGC